MPNSPEDMLAAVAASMRDRTGRSLEEWAELVRLEGPDRLDQKAVRAWLRDAHGIRQNSQWAIADAAARAAGWTAPTPAKYVDSQYAGGKATLRPIYDAIAALALGLGDDVRLEGRSTYVPFVRARQFAAVAAATASRVDLGLRFTAPPESPRLDPATAPGQSTHKIALAAASDVDDEVATLLRTAYEQNG